MKILSECKLKNELIFEILEKFIDKKIVQYEIKGKPILCPVLVKNISNTDLKLNIVTEKEKMIASVCNGQRTIDHIFKALVMEKQLYVELEDLKKCIKSLLRKKYVTMRFQL